MVRLLLCVCLLVCVAPAWAAEWQVARVRGTVTQKVSGSWQPVIRGDLIPNDRYVQTGAEGRLGLSRGRETIELEGETRIRIQDAGAELMTTVLQDFGTVAIEAERRNVQHFSVQTPFLAAVVKGTRFTVRSDQAGATVQVDRGVVQVQDTLNDLVADVRPGQEATVGTAAPLLVEGAGNAAVYSFEGVPVVNGTNTPVSADAATERSAAPPTTGQGSPSNSTPGGNGNAFGRSSDDSNANGSNNANGSADRNNGNGNGRNNDNSSGISGNSNGNGNGNGGNSGNGNGNGNNGNGNGGASSNSNANSAAASSSADDSGSDSSDDDKGNKGNNAGGNGNGKANGLNK